MTPINTRHDTCRLVNLKLNNRDLFCKLFEYRRMTALSLKETVSSLCSTVSYEHINAINLRI